MDAIREGMEFNGRVWKEPRGFIKILELVFGICAFATTSSFSSILGIVYDCMVDGKPQRKSTEIRFAYPFDLSSERINRNLCNTTTPQSTLMLGGSYSSSAEFFVAVGVLTFLYCLAALLIYIFLEKLYRSHDNVAQTDFVVTVCFAFFWLVAASAWAHGINGVKAATDPNALAGRLNNPNDKSAAMNSVQSEKEPNYANLNISVLLGFLNCFIWCGNVWFLWKETAWYRTRYPTEGLPPVGSSSSGQLPGMVPAKI